MHGPACAKFEAAMAKYCGREHAIGCASGSDALLLALLGTRRWAGRRSDCAELHVFRHGQRRVAAGAKPVFADIVPETFNLDPADVVYKITSDTKAIIPVHLFGQCAAMNEIQQIADAARGIPIIEDACQAIGAEYQGARAGSMSLAGCFSFYPTKNLGGFGDGGLITTNDAELAAKLRVLCNHGMQPRYYHHFVGLNSRLDTLQAAVLNVKLPKLDEWAAARERHAHRYATEFAELGHRRFDRRADGGQGLPACVESVHGAREERPPRCAAEASGRPENRLGDLLPRSAALAEVLWIAGLRAGQLAEDRAGLPRGAFAARVSGTDRGGARRGDRRDCGVLRSTQPRGGVSRRAERESRAGARVLLCSSSTRLLLILPSAS